MEILQAFNSSCCFVRLDYLRVEAVIGEVLWQISQWLHLYFLHVFLLLLIRCLGTLLRRFHFTFNYLVDLLLSLRLSSFNSLAVFFLLRMMLFGLLL